MKPLPRHLVLTSLFIVLTITLNSCGAGGDDERTSAPTVNIIRPQDTLNLSDKVPVEILFSDNSGLVSAEITIGNADQGNLVYHFSRRGLSGLNDNLSFEAIIPPAIDAEGKNYIIIKCYDEDGNETFIEGTFYLQENDDIQPVIHMIQPQGILTPDPQTSMSVFYDVTDETGLDSLRVSLISSVSGNLGNEIASKALKFNGEQNAVGNFFFIGNSNYQTGSKYKVKAQLFDQFGNLSEILLPNEYTISN